MDYEALLDEELVLRNADGSTKETITIWFDDNTWCWCHDLDCASRIANVEEDETAEANPEAAKERALAMIADFWARGFRPREFEDSSDEADKPAPSDDPRPERPKWLDLPAVANAIASVTRDESVEPQLERLRGLLEEHVPEQVDVLMGLAQPSIRLFPEAEEVRDEATSRFGGTALLPAPDAWPMRGQRPLKLVLQIRLEELPDFAGRAALPAAGLLSFFALDHVSDEGSEDDAFWKDYGSAGAVLYAEEVDALVAVPPPYDERWQVKPHRIRFEVEWCMPPLEGHVIEHVELPDEAHEVFWDEVWMENRTFEDGPAHRLLGYPDMNYAHHLGSDRLLFQLADDSTIGWTFGDCQDLRFIIGPDDLERADFANVRLNGDLE